MSHSVRSFAKLDRLICLGIQYGCVIPYIPVLRYQLMRRACLKTLMVDIQNVRQYPPAFERPNLLKPVSPVPRH